MKKTREKKFVTLSEAAKINNVTRQAIYVAIKQKKLKAYKNPTRWIIDLDDLEAYRNLKYSRTKSMFNGEPLFDNKKGYYSIQQAAKMLNVPYQKIYYATRIGLLKAGPQPPARQTVPRRHRIGQAIRTDGVRFWIIN